MVARRSLAAADAAGGLSRPHRGPRRGRPTPRHRAGAGPPDQRRRRGLLPYRPGTPLAAPGRRPPAVHRARSRTRGGRLRSGQGRPRRGPGVRPRRGSGAGRRRPRGRRQPHQPDLRPPPPGGPGTTPTARPGPRRRRSVPRRHCRPGRCVPSGVPRQRGRRRRPEPDQELRAGRPAGGIPRGLDAAGRGLRRGATTVVGQHPGRNGDRGMPRRARRAPPGRSESGASRSPGPPREGAEQPRPRRHRAGSRSLRPGSTPRAAAVREALRHLGVAVRRGDTFPGLDDRFLRFAVRDEETVDALGTALSTIRTRLDADLAGL